MGVQLINRPESRFLTVKVPCDGHQVRKGWHSLQEKLVGQNWSTPEIGYVLVPDWQWSSGVKELWVGVELDSSADLPVETELIISPPGTYASIRVKGDRTRMESSYNYLNQWIKDNGYERDIREGSFSIEANRLTPINPFHVPADQINEFDYTIYAPVKTDNF